MKDNYSIETVDSGKNLTNIDFEKKYFFNKKPIVIKNGIDYWPALGKWSPEYLQKKFSNKVLYLAAIKKDALGKQHIDYLEVNMQDAYNLIMNNTNPNLKYYVIQQSIYEGFEQLIPDFGIPSWADKGNDYTINLWFGEAGNKTPLHFDCTHNFLVQLHGRKRVCLFSPHERDNLYPNPYEETLKYHISEIEDIDNVDLSKYPKFQYASLHEIILNPGEVLFIPAGWWHFVHSLDVAISVNFWWNAKVNEFLLPHVLHNVVRFAYEQNIPDFIWEIIDLNDFDNNITVAKYLIDNNYKSMALLFTGGYLKEHLSFEIAKRYNIHDVDLTEISVIDRFKIFQDDAVKLLNWFNIIDKARLQNDKLLEGIDAAAIVNDIEDYTMSFNVKKKNDFVKKYLINEDAASIYGSLQTNNITRQIYSGCTFFKKSLQQNKVSLLNLLLSENKLSEFNTIEKDNIDQTEHVPLRIKF